MVCHVLVPGIFGTEMVDAQKRTIWPPGLTPGQPISDTELVDLLMAQTTTTGRVIRRAQCSGDVYGPVLDRIGQRRGGVTAFAYDWRVDIRAAAAALATQLAALPAEQPISLVGHSMGGLVVRWLLECGDYAAAPWFARIGIAVLVCAPHFGATLAVFRVLGLDGIQLVLPGWAMRALASDPQHFPAGFQLLPAPNQDCVIRPGNTNLDVFAAFPGLDPTGAAAARDIHATLDRFACPPGVPYRVAFGVGHPETVAGIKLDGGQMTETLGDGDGTVPAWSGDPTASNGAAQTAIGDVKSFVEDHVGILSNPLFLNQLDAWLDEAVPTV